MQPPYSACMGLCVRSRVPHTRPKAPVSRFPPSSTNISSALLGMLPPPKRKTPGSTGSSRSNLSVNMSMARPPPPPAGESDLSGIIKPGQDEEEEEVMVPRGVKRAKKESAMDLFGLGESGHGPP